MANHLEFTIGSDGAPFAKGMKAIEKSASEASKRIQGVLIKAGAVLAVAFGVKSFAGAVAGAVATGKELDSLGRQSGIAAEEIDLMTHALDRSGQSAESTVGILEEMRGKLRGVEQGIEADQLLFTSLGLKVDDLKGKKMPEQFAMIAEKVNAIRDPIQRAAAATAIFGANGAKAVANFNAGDIERAAKLFGTNARAMADAAPALARTSDAVHRVMQSGEVFVSTVVAKLAPAFEFVAAQMEELLPQLQDVAATVGEKLQTAFEVIVGLFKEGKLGEALKLSFEVGAREGANLLAQVMTFAGRILGEAVFAAFQVISSGKIFSGFAKAFESVGKFLTGVLLEAFKTPIKWFQDRLQAVIEQAMELLAKIGIGPEGFKARSVAEIEKANEGKVEIGTMGGIKSADELIMALDEAGEGFGKFDFTAFDDLMKGIPAAWKESATDAFSNPEAKAKLADLFAQAQKTGAATVKAFTKPLETKRPGEGGAAVAATIRETSFDAFRRVGGGLASGATTIAQRSLDRLTGIDDKMKELVSKLSDTGGGLSGGPARSGFIPMSS